MGYMKAILFAYVAVIIVVGTIFLGAMHWGTYKKNLRDKMEAIEEAYNTLNTDLCKSIEKRASAGRFDPCKNANRTVSISAYEQAFDDTLQDIFCGKTGCSPIFLKISNSLWTIFMASFVLFVLIFSFMLVRFSRARYDSKEQYLTLPHLASSNWTLVDRVSGKKLE